MVLRWKKFYSMSLRYSRPYVKRRGREAGKLGREGSYIFGPLGQTATARPLPRTNQELALIALVQAPSV